MAQNLHRRPSYHDIDGTHVVTEKVSEGDTLAMRVSWFDWRSVTHFHVEETYEHIDELKLRGTDGHIYRLHGWDGKIICNTDDKKGSHRGNLAGRIKRLD